MSKKAQSSINRLSSVSSDKTDGNVLKLHENSILEIVVGPLNVKRWNALKAAFSCTTNENFSTRLLDIAQQYLNSESEKDKSEDNHKTNGSKKSPASKLKKKKIVSVASSNKKPKIVREETPQEVLKTEQTEARKSIDITDKPSELTQKATAKKPINKISDDSTENSSISEESVSQKSPKFSLAKLEEKSKKKKSPPDKLMKKEKVDVKTRKQDFNVRKAPELETQQKDAILSEKSNTIKQKICLNCNTKHSDNRCPLIHPSYIITDGISLEDWTSRYQTLYQNNGENIKTEKEDDNNYSYAQLSLPSVLRINDTYTNHGAGVFTNTILEQFTEFGPLVGKVVKEVDIPEDFSMRDLWEIPTEDQGNIYVNTEDLEASNWMRFVRPAPSRDEKNLIVISRGDKLYFVSVRNVEKGEELLFWQDSTLSSGKKKLEKTSCGGCNMTFTHPIYYRTHCSVFHDVRYSLTIRKYHCKVCGAAVLGKENIMKHAAELHNGQGAYQCQFCKKFFLRLNYLEMHRTYGCSANPHRSRPLCDFCGRKFCQPQKLKVHIKRMHSDISEVLKEFQCKNCLKILGSRAALQRHLKEVHQKQLDGACSCTRCGKHFQNKSNLKIHMLTHSGIKPFKCVAVGGNCNAAFTTKQCLQFHYKKMHGFTEDTMPKIERSIDYTFQAYSGFEDDLDKKDEQENVSSKSSSNLQIDEDSDMDDASLDSKSMDDPPAMHSPLMDDPQSPPPICSPPTTEYINPPAMKILSKGSKKWIGDQPMHPLKPPELYQMDHRLNKDDLPGITLQEAEMYERTKLGLSDFGRQDASNASLLVEAALDSVCSEPNIDIDVSSTGNCTDSLVNNLYTLAQPDNLPEVSYSETVCMSEQRDINLMSPSVNDHISVTDELNDELRHSHSINMDYSNFHQEDFSPGNSPGGMQHRSSFVRNYINQLSPPQNYNQKSLSPVPSPPRYDFGHSTQNEHLSSDDSNGMAAQNLSINNSKTNDIQLDLSIYKSPGYKLDSYQPRKDFRLKFEESDMERKQMNVLGVDNLTKNYLGTSASAEQSSSMEQNDAEEKLDHDRGKYPDDLSSDMRNKFDIDLDLRLKNYEMEINERQRQNAPYEGTGSSDVDFRVKPYDLIEGVEGRVVKSYDNLESDFRGDRNFVEPLVLNSSSEIQGLDMSARSFHNYTNLNRYHHLYPEVDRVDLRLNYSPPPPSYTHADILRVVSLDLTPPGRHSVDLSLRSHPFNSRLLTEHGIHQNRLLDQSRLLGTDLAPSRHLGAEGRILSDHTTNRILGNDHLLGAGDSSRLLADESRILSEQPRLLEQSRLMGDGRILPPAAPSGSVSPVPTFSGYSQSPYHPTPLAPRPHVTSPTPSPYHHYSTYY